MILALTIIHVVISLALVVVVLLQHGKQQGLSGAIAGGAETFFGKNKGRTVDAMLKKFTAVIAILFIVTSVTLAALTARQGSASSTTTDTAETQQNMTVDESGNLVDENGNVLMTAEEMQQQAAEDGSAGTEATGDAAAEGDTAGTEGTADAAAEGGTAEAGDAADAAAESEH